MLGAYGIEFDQGSFLVTKGEIAIFEFLSSKSEAARRAARATSSSTSSWEVAEDQGQQGPTREEGRRLTPASTAAASTS